MSPHSIRASVWTSTKWLWVVLAVCLVGWRVSNRVDQYHASIVSPAHQAKVMYFDANERNAAALLAVRSLSRLVAAHVDRVVPAAELEPLVVAFHEREWDDGANLSPIHVDSVSLFSNPPPFLS